MTRITTPVRRRRCCCGCISKGLELRQQGKLKVTTGATKVAPSCWMDFVLCIGDLQDCNKSRSDVWKEISYRHNWAQ